MPTFTAFTTLATLATRAVCTVTEWDFDVGHAATMLCSTLGKRKKNDGFADRQVNANPCTAARDRHDRNCIVVHHGWTARVTFLRCLK
jgi:hypothetical protein